MYLIGQLHKRAKFQWRFEKALEAIYVYKDPIEEEDERLLCVMLNAFSSVGQQEMTRIVKEKARKVAYEEDQVPEPKPLSKEAVQLQMNDQFERQLQMGPRRRRRPPESDSPTTTPLLDIII
ncbi:hypothetical protein LOK49_LG08G00399 [Camellia lanceoleosa]|uniref:Uncharacterized protein n=1 Tax=Camellia lanceoleosa TaxID=1840588 RepID=A0ACC0GY02_9ERIC|nr:hypothetical protein LOK49_LG08G00399 [Camellia lanceoleosa]